VLGTMEAWADGSTSVRDASGVLHVISVADIVSGKPVPPRPSVRLRVGVEEAERRANRWWPPVVAEPLGAWLLRASGGFSTRANSVLAVGDPGVPTGLALASVARFYSRRDLPALAQVVVGAQEQHDLEEGGWVRARPGEADTLFQIASVSAARRALRALRSRVPVDPPPVTVSTTASADWLANDPRAQRHPEEARRVLEGPDQVAFVSVGAPVLAKGRVALDGDWAGVTDVWVGEDQRRRGLGLLVLGELLGWAAERGATTVCLQTRADNEGALALYERVGFLTHHSYRYLTRR
jgi:N-acetylglutamate synthase